MIGFKPGKYIDEGEKLAKRVRKAGWDALRRLGFLIRAKGQSEIEVADTTVGEWRTMPDIDPKTGKRRRAFIRDDVSAPGEPPKTAKKRLPRSILYGTPDEGPPSVIAGPAKNLAGTLGEPLESGGAALRDGREIAPRPFMAPALAAEIGELPGLLADKLADL